MSQVRLNNKFIKEIIQANEAAGPDKLSPEMLLLTTGLQLIHALKNQKNCEAILQRWIRKLCKELGLPDILKIEPASKHTLILRMVPTDRERVS
jgi:hypothetical protein